MVDVNHDNPLANVNFTEAFRCYALAAMQRNAVGQQKVARCYHSGKYIKPNFKKAIKWYKKAYYNPDNDDEQSKSNIIEALISIIQKESVKYYKKNF